MATEVNPSLAKAAKESAKNLASKIQDINLVELILTTDKSKKLDYQELYPPALSFMLFLKDRIKAKSFSPCALGHKLNQACSKSKGDPNSIVKALGFKDLKDADEQFRAFLNKDSKK
jgi:hypothetical protein